MDKEAHGDTCTLCVDLQTCTREPTVTDVEPNKLIRFLLCPAHLLKSNPNSGKTFFKDLMAKLNQCLLPKLILKHRENHN